MEYTVYEIRQSSNSDGMAEFQQVTVKKENSEIRQKGGIKSIIVDKVEKEETLYLQETAKTGAKVRRRMVIEDISRRKIFWEPETVTEEYAKAPMPEFTSVRRDDKINLAGIR